MTTDALTRQELLALAIRMQEEEGPPRLSEKEGGSVCLDTLENLEKLSTNAIRKRLLDNCSEVLH